MPIWLIITLSLISGWLLTLISLKPIQMLQLSSYRASAFSGWLKRTKYDYIVRYFALAFFCFTSMFVYVMCFGTSKVYYLGYIFFALLCLYFLFATLKGKQKTPLKFTRRVIRLIIVDFILLSALSFALIYFTKDTFFMYSLTGILPLLCPFVLLFSHFIILPLEKAIGALFIGKAVKKLNALSPIIIGITGSYGKTTVKNILAAFLSTKYKVFVSPMSYNTPMGLSKCINESYNGEEIFIAEMGARYVGDITYLKRIFKPQYAILTAIGNQHLETFGSKDNIIKEKTALIRDVKFAVANGDNEEIVQNAQGAALCGSSGKAVYSMVRTSIDGTDFVLTIGGESEEIHTKLVGEHVPVSITMSALMANKLGVSLKDISRAAKELPYVKHRLEVIKNGGITILDDSYNSNPSGAESALNILSSFEGTKVIITPGFVELGSESEESLKALGKKIASICDYAFLVGANAQAIKSGMGEYENAVIVSSLDEAMEELKKIELPLAVLFENDLPDNY